MKIEKAAATNVKFCIKKRALESTNGELYNKILGAGFVHCVH